MASVRTRLQNEFQLRQDKLDQFTLEQRLNQEVNEQVAKFYERIKVEVESREIVSNGSQLAKFSSFLMCRFLLKLKGPAFFELVSLNDAVENVLRALAARKELYVTLFTFNYFVWEMVMHIQTKQTEQRVLLREKEKVLGQFLQETGMSESDRYKMRLMPEVRQGFGNNKERGRNPYTGNRMGGSDFQSKKELLEDHNKKLANANWGSKSMLGDSSNEYRTDGRNKMRPGANAVYNMNDDAFGDC